MKTKILILAVEECSYESLLKRELKELTEKYEVILSSGIVDALDKIAKAKLIENSPILGLVFQRNTLASNKGCGIVCRFAEAYADKLVVAINMLWNDQDSDARYHSVSANYCKSDDWQQVKVIFDNHFKE